MESRRVSHPQILVVFAVLSLLCNAARGGPVGVCYGRAGDNLPTPIQAAALLQSLGVTRVRIFDADSGVIQSFADTGIDISISVRNDELTGIALAQSTSDQWIATNVLPFVPATNISSISVGSEVAMFDSGNISSFLVPAMVNIYNSLTTTNLESQIKVTTANAMTILSKSYPPSAGAFDSSLIPTVVTPMLNFLSQTGSPFLLNSYPYYAYVGDPNGVPLAYALFAPNNGVVDPGNSLQYTNLLDAQIDAVYAAMAALNFSNIEIVVAETGWPSRGDAEETAASVSNAQTYNQNLIDHVVSSAGTPLKPGATTQTYIFSLYNEDLKNGPTSERNFGIYNPDSTPVYSLNFNGGNSQGQANRTWCIARNEASNASLAIAINYACANGANCEAIQQGGSCYEPNTYVNHASYAFNDYYQRSNMDIRACNFSNTAALTQRDPSYGGCTYYARTPSSAQNLWQGFEAHQRAQLALTVLLSLLLLLKLTD